MNCHIKISDIMLMMRLSGVVPCYKKKKVISAFFHS